MKKQKVDLEDEVPKILLSVGISVAVIAFCGIMCMIVRQLIEEIREKYYDSIFIIASILILGGVIYLVFRKKMF